MSISVPRTNEILIVLKVFLLHSNDLKGAPAENSCTGLSMHVAPKALVWRKKGEGLIITAKGSKDLVAGKRLHVMVAIACNKGVILCKPHDKNE